YYFLKARLNHQLSCHYFALSSACNGYKPQLTRFFSRRPDQSHIDPRPHEFHAVSAKDDWPSHWFPPADWFEPNLSIRPHIRYKCMRPRLQSASRLQTAVYRRMNNAFVLEDVRTYLLHYLNLYNLWTFS